MVANNLKWYWLSFSNNGTNQGCCNVQAESEETALQKTINLKICPKYNDILYFVLTEPELEADTLYSPQDLTDLGHTRIKNH